MFSEEGLEKVIDRETANITEYGYKGFAYTMIAEHYTFPTSKLRAFNTGKAMIDSAIKKFPNNLELRYIRLLVQLNAPSFLGYNKSIDVDYGFFIRNITSSTISVYWRKKFISNISQTNKIGLNRKKKLIELRDKL